MKVVNHYITSLYIRLIGLTTGAFTALYTIIDLLEKIRRFSHARDIAYHLPYYYLYKTPSIINQILPLAVLMSTLLTLGILSRSSEIVAMQSCGISLRTITKPILVIALVLSLLSFFVNETIIPETSQKMKYIEEVLLKGKSPNTFFRLNNIWYRDNNVILQARLFIPSAQTLQGITLWQVSDTMLPTMSMEADEGIWNGKSWTFQNALVREFDHGRVSSTKNLKTIQVPLNLATTDLSVSDKYAQEMGFFKLRKYAEKLKKGGYDATRYFAQMHASIALPFACLIMAFVGIPFALRGGRTSGIAFGIGISLGIGFAYFVINSTLIAFGQTGVLPPLVSAWAANFIFSLSAIWLTLTIHH